MAGLQTTYKSEKTSSKKVYYEGTDTLYEGYALCYNVDATASASDPVPSTYRVEKPSATNLNHFAGLVAVESAGKTGPCVIRIYEPDKTQKVNAYIGINTVIDSTLLCLTPAQYYLGGVGASAVVVARAMATNATLTGTPGVGLVKLNPSVADNLASVQIGSSSAYVTTAVADVKFWEVRTASSYAGVSQGLYWWHKMTGAGAQGQAGRFMTLVEGAGAVGVYGMHNSLSFGATTGNVTGLGCANRATIMVPDRVLTGTVAAVQAEIYAEADESAVTKGAFFRACLDGEATGVALLNNDLALLDIDGVTIGAAAAGNVVDALAGDVAATHVAHIRINGVNYYLLMRNAVA